MIQIDKVVWLSEEAKEAEILLSDGNFNLVCFSHPFEHTSKTFAPKLLYTLNAKDIFRIEGEERFSIEKKEGSFDYRLVGKVVDKEKGHIKIGEFIIELDSPLPGDTHIGNYISFVCERIDIY